MYEVRKLSNSICRFIPSKGYSNDIKTIEFVYESELKKLSQPFIRPIFGAYLVIKNNGILKIANKNFDLVPGSLFFSFPGCPFEIEANDNFRYIYISFIGKGASSLFEDFGISIENPVCNGLEHIIPFWLDSIKRINQTNANVLTECVLLYTMSFLEKSNDEIIIRKNNENLFVSIVEYIDNNFADTDMSIKKIADVFSYTEKYLSALFCKNMKTKFRSYLNSLRIQYANKLIDEGEASVTRLSEQCGYSDTQYFSQVYKNKTGITPKEKIKIVTKERTKYLGQ